MLRKRGVLPRYYSNHEIEKLSFHNGTVSCGKNMFSYSRKKTLYIYDLGKRCSTSLKLRSAKKPNCLISMARDYIFADKNLIRSVPMELIIQI